MNQQFNSVSVASIGSKIQRLLHSKLKVAFDQHLEQKVV